MNKRRGVPGERRYISAEQTYDLDSILMPLCTCDVVLQVLRLKRLDTGKPVDVYFCSDCGVVHVEPPKWDNIKAAKDPEHKEG